MFERLEQIEARYEGLGRQLADPKVLSDQAQYQKIMRHKHTLSGREVHVVTATV